MSDETRKQLLGLLSDMRDAAREWELSALSLSLAAEETTSNLLREIYRHQASTHGYAKGLLQGFARRLTLIVGR